MIVKFENHENDFIKKSEEIPDESLRHCQAHVTFSEQNERVITRKINENKILTKSRFS